MLQYSKYNLLYINCRFHLTDIEPIRPKVEICERNPTEKYTKCRRRICRKSRQQKICQNVNNSVESWRPQTPTELENCPPAWEVRVE